MPYNAKARIAEEKACQLLDPFFSRYSMPYFIHGATEYGIYLPEYSDVDFQACFELSSFDNIDDCDNALRSYSKERGMDITGFVDITSGNKIYVYEWPSLKVDLGILLTEAEFEESKKNTVFQREAYNPYIDMGRELKTAFHRRPDFEELKRKGLSFSPLMAIAVHVAREQQIKRGRSLWSAVLDAVKRGNRFSVVPIDSQKSAAYEYGPDELMVYHAFHNCCDGHGPARMPRKDVIEFFEQLADKSK